MLTLASENGWQGRLQMLKPASPPLDRWDCPLGVKTSMSFSPATSTSIDTNLSRAYLEPLLAGDRNACRAVVDGAISGGVSAIDLLTQLIWPTMELLQSLYREDRISIASLNLATRLNRQLTDQLTAKLERNDPHGRKALIFCGNAEPEELGGQICADLFEVDGWTVRFAGGGVPDDEVLKLIGDERPDLLVMFGTLPSGVPAVRKLIDYLREVNSCPNMQVMCCGGIYKRAEGLAEEIGADLYAPDAAEAVEVANAHPTKKATVDQQTVGRTRRIRKAEARKAQSITRIAPAPVVSTPAA
jgi:MerR family transcriptional regulator, light-induced transcriptional regulator